MVHTYYIDFIVFFALLVLLMFIIFSQPLSMLHKVYIFLHLSFIHWALLQFASKVTDLINFKFLLVQTSYLVLSTMSVMFYIFSIIVINKIQWFKTRYFKFSIIPVIMLLLLALFNPNDWFLREYTGPASEKVIGQGILFNFLSLVSFFYIVLVLFLLVHTYRKKALPTATKRQILFTLVGIGVLFAFAFFDFVYNILLVDRFNRYFPFLSLGMLFSATYMTLKIKSNNVLNIIGLAHRDVVNTMSAGILIVDIDGYIVEMNAHISSMIKLKVGDILDFNYLMDAFPNNDWKSIMIKYDKQKYNPYSTISYDLVVKGYSEQFAFIRCHPIVNKSSVILGYIYTVQDVTKMKNLVESTRLQNELLTERNRELIETQDQLHIVNKQLEKIATTDPLTECYNRRYLIRLLETKVPYNIEHSLPFTVIIMDLDFFKSINDKYGHLAGDRILKSTAQLLQDCIGEHDAVARFGGEEFIIYFDNVSREMALDKISKIKHEIEKNAIWLENIQSNVSVTVSIGVISIDAFDILVNNVNNNLHYDIIALADKALYEAKDSGRNTIVERTFALSHT